MAQSECLRCPSKDTPQRGAIAPNPILDFPKEILFQVFAFLDPHFLVTKVALVCKAWRDLVREDAFWRSFRFLSLETQKGGAPFAEKVISKCPNLRYLKINGSHCGERVPIDIPRSSLPHLRTLCFNYVMQSCEEALRNVLLTSPHLRSLSLVDNYKPLSETVVEIISRLTRLVSLEIMMLYVVENEKGLAKLFGSSCRLQHVHLSIPESLDEDVVENVLRNCSSTLTSLTLLNSFAERAFRNVVKCSKLAELKIGCSELTDKSLRLLKGIPTLHTLTLQGGNRFTTGGLRSLFGGKTLVTLRHLAVVDCGAFDDSNLDAVTTHYGDALESLNLDYCARVTGKGIDHVMRRCHHLQVLRLGSLSVNYAFLRQLHQHLPRLRLLVLLDRNVDVVDVRRFVEQHPVYRTKKCQEISDDGFYRLYARCLDHRNLRPIVAFMNQNLCISALAHASCD